MTSRWRRNRVSLLSTGTPRDVIHDHRPGRWFRLLMRHENALQEFFGHDRRRITDIQGPLDINESEVPD